MTRTYSLLKPGAKLSRGSRDLSRLLRCGHEALPRSLHLSAPGLPATHAPARSAFPAADGGSTSARDLISWPASMVVEGDLGLSGRHRRPEETPDAFARGRFRPATPRDHSRAPATAGRVGLARLDCGRQSGIDSIPWSSSSIRRRAAPTRPSTASTFRLPGPSGMTRMCSRSLPVQPMNRGCWLSDVSETGTGPPLSPIAGVPFGSSPSAARGRRR